MSHEILISIILAIGSVVMLVTDKRKGPRVTFITRICILLFLLSLGTHLPPAVLEAIEDQLIEYLIYDAEYGAQ